MNVFIDTHTLMDVLLKREPFASDGQRIWFLAERGRVRGFISALSFPNIYYVVRKLRGRAPALSMMTMLRDTFVPVALDDQILNQAIDAAFSDFEDAIQYFSARRAGAAALVTRDPGHFPRGAPPVLSPAQFLATHTFK